MITDAGVYRCKGFMDWGISETNNGFPQFVVRLTAEEYYDPQVDQYVAGSGEDMLGYFVLFGSNGNATLNMKQILAVTGFDGATLSGLAALDLTATPVMFRVEPHIYEGKTTLQMTWIDVYDASPMRSVKKLDGDALKKLDGKFANAFKQTQGPAKPISAPSLDSVSEPEAPKKRGRPAGIANKPKVTETVIPMTQGAPPTAPPKAPPKAASIPQLIVGTCNKDEAWATCVDTKNDSVTDDMLGEAWLDAVDAVAPGIEDEAITLEQWFRIKELVQAKTAVI